MNLFNHHSHPSHSSLFTFHSNSFMVWSSSTIGHDVELLCFVRTFSMVGISLYCAWLSFISLCHWILSYSCEITPFQRSSATIPRGWTSCWSLSALVGSHDLWRKRVSCAFQWCRLCRASADAS